jgi:hypothetical protein
MAFIKGPLAVDRGFPSLFAQAQTNLFKNTAFGASDDGFQETPLLRKGKDKRLLVPSVYNRFCNRQEHPYYFESC